MKLNKDNDKSILDIKNDMGIKIFEMRFVEDNFVVYLCESVTITKSLDEDLYNELNIIMNNDYYFSSPYSMQDKDTIIWTSDESYDTNGNLDLSKINRLMIKKERDQIHLSYSNPYFDNSIFQKQYGVVVFSQDENGQYSKNLKTNSTFQKDMIRLFRNVITKNKVLQK